MRSFLGQPIAWICVASFVISVSYAFYYRIEPLVDARAYDRIGWNLAQGLGYRESLSVPLINDIGIARVGPGYEFFLAFVYILFGHAYWPVWIIQALLLSFTAYFVYRMGEKVFFNSWSRSAGLLAAGLIAFSPDLITVSAMLMTEILGIFFMTLALYIFFRYYENGRTDWLLLFGLVFGTAIAVRTPALFLAFPILVFFLKERRIKHLLLAFGIAVLVFTPWIIRNYRVYGEFVPLNANIGYNILGGNHPGASGEQEPVPILENYLETLGVLGANKQAIKDGLEYIVQNPVEFIGLTLKRTSIYFSFARPTGFWFHLQGLGKFLTLAFSTVYGFLMFLLGGLGIACARSLLPEERKRALFFLALFIMMPLAIVGLVVETRYRFSAYPFLAVFAGFGFKELYEKRIPLKAQIAVLSIVVLNGAVDIARNWARILERFTGF